MNDGTELKLKDFGEKTLVLYYYPKDSTPGCTTEANGFSAAIAEFEKKNVTVIGVSADSAKSHCSFIEKQGLKFKLATDEVVFLFQTNVAQDIIINSETGYWEYAWYQDWRKATNVFD